MARSTETSRRFWREVLIAGGSSVIPRWCTEPLPGVVETQVLLEAGLVAGLRRVAGALAVSLSSVLLAGHARVLAALCGQREVVVGYVARGASGPLPCRLDTDCRVWRELLAESFCVESAALLHRGVAVEQMRARLGVVGPVFETVFDPTGGDGEAIGGSGTGVVLWVGVAQREDGLVLRLRCRGEVWDAEALSRVGGYHLRALESIAADVEAEHSRVDLLSPEEVEFQFEGLAGPRRELPCVRAHELFEAWAKVAPDAPAAVCGDRRWSYRELNAHANRLGRALLARGLRPEDVVAVVCERNLGWMAAVLAIFKAGGAYLPIEPHFPATRIAATLARAGCQLVITEPDSTSTLEAALEQLPDVRTLFTDDAYAEDHADDDLGVDVLPDQLAYIYFTSGSTGEPKGAMCEHAGMLNHLYAKIADTGLGEGQVLAQTAPQCFDISLWQLLAAPLVGGTTLLVAQDTILDVGRFLDTIVEARVAVVQVVPSYLEAVLTHLERTPRALPDLRCVSTTGEALKKELTVRWFAAQPDIALLNAYGLTETSDDTNHELMHRPPQTERVPLGPPIPNVHIFLVDEHLRPVPLGAPGEIVYSGVCVGRGYINDPQRTEAAYLSDPHRPGHRLYRGGDIGRWLPDGKLEFLGRRDSQVKIRGFRIEIGEIENALLGADGVRDGAVVIAGEGHHPRLVAFYTSPDPIPAYRLREQLGRSLPDYMLPGSFHWRAQLPLTPNSKIDHKALTALAAGLAAAAHQDLAGPGGQRGGHEPPQTDAERRLADAWARVLGVPVGQLGRHDDFFDRGGTSLSAVKLAIILNRVVSLRDITEHPTLAELVELVDDRTPRLPVESAYGSAS
jgi:amino acid adenylation domain-containing protein